MQLSSSVLLCLLVLANIAWGGAFVANIIALQSFSLGHILFARVFFAALCYGLLWRHYLPLKTYHKGDWRWLLALVVCEPCLLFLFETLSLRYTTASQGGIIAACAPIAVAVGAFFAYRETIGKRCVLGMLLALLGVAMVLLTGDEATVAANPLLGNLFMGCAVLASTVYALLVKRLSASYPVVFLSALQCIGSSVIFLPMALAAPMPESPSLTAWLCLAYLGFIVTFLSYFIINTAISRIKAGHAMLFTNLIPVSALFFAFVILGERLNMMQYAGATLVLGGMVLAGNLASAQK